MTTTALIELDPLPALTMRVFQEKRYIQIYAHIQINIEYSPTISFLQGRNVGMVQPW